MVRSFLIAIVVFLLFVVNGLAQDKPEALAGGHSASFTMGPGDVRAFSVKLQKDAYAELVWTADSSITLSYCLATSSGKILETGDSMETDSAAFIAPAAGDYFFFVRYDKEPETKQTPQHVKIEHRSTFKLPPSTKQKAMRKINGYTVRIMTTPNTDTTTGSSWVLFEKGATLQKVMKASGGEDFSGFSFPEAVRGKPDLIATTPDKTGDGVPDIMIDYFSGGAHCCFSSYFINLGDTATEVDSVDTGNADLTPTGLNPKGGLRFRTADNAFAYWNTSFAGSPLPAVTVEFDNGRLKPNFDLMKKPAPPLTTLQAKARAARAKINNEPYGGVDVIQFEDAFWGEMLDLIYTGNEDAAWKYFDLVWPAGKQGKATFLDDFKKQLSESYYGSRTVDVGSAAKTWQPLVDKYASH